MGFVKTLGFTRVNASIVASPEMSKSSLLFTNDETIASNSSMFFFCDAIVPGGKPPREFTRDFRLVWLVVGT